MKFREFAELLSHFAKADNVTEESVLFGDGLNMPSIAFLEFILEIEARTGLDIDVDSLSASIKTAGQLHRSLFSSDA